MAASAAEAAPVPPSQLESVVRLTRDGPRTVRLHELARSMGRARNHVARELGVPTVVQVRGATAEVVTGARLRIDGAAGRVEILEPATRQEAS